MTSLRHWLMMRVATPCALLTFVLTWAGCAGGPQPVTETPAQPKPDAGPTLKAKEGLSFHYRSALDGSNTDPRFDATGYESSDGEKVTSEWRSFKRREDAAKYYSDLLARASAVLEDGGGNNELSGAAQQHAVIEFVARNGARLAAVVKLNGSSVNEIIGPTAGHVLAFEKWREVHEH